MFDGFSGALLPFASAEFAPVPGTAGDPPGAATAGVDGVGVGAVSGAGDGAATTGIEMPKICCTQTGEIIARFVAATPP